MGILNNLFDMFETSTSKRSNKHKNLQTVEIKVKMDCDGCERRVKNAVSLLKGVKSVEVNRKQSRVIVRGFVRGFVEPKRVLEKVKSTGKRAEFWPYVKVDLVSYPYVAGAYDKRAPAGYVRNVPHAVNPTPDTERFITMFSDDNTNACSIM